MASKKQKLEEFSFSKLILLEDDDGSGDYGYYSGIDPYSGNHGNGGYGSPSGGKSVARMFFDPLADIAKTAVWGIERISANIRLLIPGFAKILFFGLIPWSEGLLPGSHFMPISYVFNQFRKKEEQLLHKIDNKYKDVLQRNIEALKNNDVWGLALLLNPNMLIGEKLIEHAPDTVYFIINTIAGGLLDELAKNAHAGDYVHEFFDNNEKANTNKQAVLKLFAKTYDLNDFKGFKEFQEVGSDILIQRYQDIMRTKTIQEFANQLEPAQRAGLKDFVKQIYEKSNGQKYQGGEIGAAILSEIKKAYSKLYVDGLKKLPQTLAITKAIEHLKSTAV